MCFLKKAKEYVPTWTMISFLVLILAFGVYLASLVSPEFAGAVNSTVSHFFRYVAAKLSFIFPFSLFELVIILALPLIVLVGIMAYKLARDRKRVFRLLFSVLGVISVLYSSYLLMLGVGYRTQRISESMNITLEKEIETDELYRVALLMRDEVNSLAPLVNSDGGVSDTDLSLYDMSLVICESYSDFALEYPILHSFYSVAKPIRHSSLMSDMGITGIYGYFTGEANINIEYPDYTLPYTVAHELAHQRGICREDEANFVAFLVCIGSSDPYVRYSGYLNMLEYLASSVYRADKTLYEDLMSGLDDGAWSDVRAATEVTLAHRDSPLGKIMDRINDSYLKSNGTEGIVSYGLVTRLTVAYYSKTE